ncbi:MAG: hypothetical protein ABI970_10465, partial [Chloroflexota bacterium]
SGDTVAAPNLSLDDSEPSLSLKPIGSQTTGTTSPLIFIMAGLLPLLGVAAIGYQQWNKTRKAQLEKRIRQQQAAQIAIRNLKALALADSKSSYQVIEKIFNRYLSDKLDMDLKVVKQSNLMQLLTQNGTSENIKSKVQVFVLDIEEGQFSPSAEDIAPQKTEDLVKLLRDIDAEWIVP